MDKPRRELLLRCAEECHIHAAKLADLSEVLLRAGLPDVALEVASMAKEQAALSYDCLMAARRRETDAGAGSGGA